MTALGVLLDEVLPTLAAATAPLLIDVTVTKG
jgi:hypothetical protein